MKKSIVFLMLFSITMTMIFQSCVEDKCKNKSTYTKYVPIYSTGDEFRHDPQYLAARPMENIGKLYFYNQYVFINEIDEGIHIINNQDPSNPITEAFIAIKGNKDLAVKNNILYADSYADLLAINISNLSYPELMDREKDVFTNVYHYHEGSGYVIGYERTVETRTIDCYHSYWGHLMFEDGVELFATADAGLGNTVSASQVSSGIAGSMARFGLYQDYLYCLDEGYIDVFDIQDVTNPEFSNTEYIGWNIETIFPYGENLFIGAADGMYILDNSNPTMPSYMAKFEHARACDPVYVKGDYAFVTLRDGTECESFTNQLDVVDIRNLASPFLVKTYPMQNPHGLSVTFNDKLYICEGTNGFKILDASNVNDIVEIGAYRDIDAFDIIALGENHVMVIGQDGFYQFDTSSPEDVQVLSFISTSN